MLHPKLSTEHYAHTHTHTSSVTHASMHTLTNTRARSCIHTQAGACIFTHLIFRDVVGVPQSLLKVTVERTIYGIGDPDLHPSEGLVARSWLGPVGRVVALLPAGHHELTVVVVVVDETKVVVVHSGIHVERAHEFETGKGVFA